MTAPVRPAPSSVPVASILAQLLKQRADATDTRGAQQQQMVQSAADAERARHDHMGRAMAAADSVPTLIAAKYKQPWDDFSAEAQEDRAPAAMQASAHMRAQDDSMTAAHHLAMVLMSLAGRRGYAGVGQPFTDPTNGWADPASFPRGRPAPPLPVSPLPTRPAGR